MWIYLNDRFVEEKDARVSVYDHGFLYGDGVYETLRIYDGRILHFEQHIQRVQQSCQLIGLEFPLQPKAYLDIFAECLKRNDLNNAVLRLTISRGEGEWGLDPNECRQPTIVVLARPFMALPAEWHEQGLRLEIVTIRRNAESAQSPKIKSLSFLNNVLGKQEAIKAGAHDALMLNIDGFLAECTTSNIFFVMDQRIYTPSVECGILEGITREIVFVLARELGFKLEQGMYRPEQLLLADECFITNTGIEVMPVTRIGEHAIGTGSVGPVSQQLRDAFQKNVPRFVGPCLLET